MKKTLWIFVALCLALIVGCESQENVQGSAAENMPADKVAFASENVAPKDNAAETKSDETPASQVTDDKNGNAEDEKKSDASEKTTYDKIYDFITVNGVVAEGNFVLEQGDASTKVTMNANSDGTMVWSIVNGGTTTKLYLESDSEQVRTESMVTISGGSYVGESVITTLNVDKISESDDFITNGPSAMYDKIQASHTDGIKNAITKVDEVLAKDGLKAADILK